MKCQRCGHNFENGVYLRGEGTVCVDCLKLVKIYGSLDIGKFYGEPCQDDDKACKLAINAKYGRFASIRPELQWFAVKMEDKLSKNDWKGGWQNFSLPDLLKKLQGEVQELTDAINDMLWVATYNHFYGSEMPMSVPVNRVIMEAADVANFAMMAAERSNAGLEAKEGK